LSSDFTDLSSLQGPISTPVNISWKISYYKKMANYRKNIHPDFTIINKIYSSNESKTFFISLLQLRGWSSSRFRASFVSYATERVNNLDMLLDSAQAEASNGRRGTKTQGRRIKGMGLQGLDGLRLDEYLHPQDETAWALFISEKFLIKQI